MPVCWHCSNSCDPHEQRKDRVLHLVVKICLTLEKTGRGEGAPLKYPYVMPDNLNMIGIDPYGPMDLYETGPFLIGRCRRFNAS
jgi:hypothetical protein